jgi:hypothetical protein
MRNAYCEATCSLSEINLLTQVDLNDFVRNLYLSQKQAEFLGSTFQK